MADHALLLCRDADVKQLKMAPWGRLSWISFYLRIEVRSGQSAISFLSFLSSSRLFADALALRRTSSSTEYAPPLPVQHRTCLPSLTVPPRQLLRSPTFHRGVRRIHRTVEDLRHGRDPSEPLRQGEATGISNAAQCSRGRAHALTKYPAADPNKTGGFFKHFVEELRNQARGQPTDVPPSPPKK